MLRAIRYVAPAVIALLAPAPSAQPSPGLRFEAPPALQAPRPNTLFAAPGMAEDAAGFAWFATESGLVRFDGQEAKTYRAAPGDLSSTLLYTVLAGPQGALWVAASSGRLAHFDPLSGRAAVVTFPVDGVRALYPALAPDGTLWIGTAESGLFRLRPGHLDAQPVPLPGVDTTATVGATTVRVDGEGRAWIAASGRGLFRVDAPAGRPRRIEVPGEILLDSFNNGLHVDQRGRTWVLSTRGLLRYDSARDRFALALGAERWPSLDEHAAPLPLARRIADEGHRWLVDGHDRLWIGSGDAAGLAVLDLRTGHLARYRHRPDDPVSAPNSPTITFFEDRAGGVWVSTYQGLRRVTPPSTLFRHLSVPTPDRSTRLALDRQGRLLVSVFCGTTYRLGPLGTFERHPAFPPGLSLCALDAYEDADGALWVATFAYDAERGLHRLRPDGTHTRYTSLPDDPGPLSQSLLRVLHEDPKGRLWVGTEAGLVRYDPATDHFVRVQATDDAGAPFGQETIWTVTDDGSGGLWVGTYEQGLVHFDPASNHARRYRSDPADPHTLPSNIITAVVLSQAAPGAVWVGTYDGGLARLDPETGEALRCTTHDGLLSDGVRSVVEDRRGQLWASTDAGLVRLDPATGALRTFTEADGLLDSAFSLYAGLALPDGRLAFATPKHVVVFDPDHVDLAREAAPLALTALRVYDAERPVEATPREVRFTPDDDFFTFEFAALDFATASRARYRYRLDGFDRDWIEAGTRRAATYTNVPPGRYTLRVEANLGGEWGQSALAVPVVVEPRWWEVWWVRLAGGLLALGAVVGGTRRLAGRRLRRRLAVLEAERTTERALQTERARIAADVHDHVGATLTRIQLLSELSQRSRNGRGTAYTAKIAESARAATQDLDAIVWAVNPAHDRLDAFADYLCTYAAEFCEAAGLRCRFERPAAWPEGRLPAEVRYPAFVVVKEALCNAARHARATTIRLRFLSDADAVAVEVEDDGAGFDPAEVDTFSNGLQTMRQRAEAAGGRLAVESAPGTGTRVRIILPLEAATEG